MTVFTPHIEVLPPEQRAVWAELHKTPEHFTLYGGTAIALHLGHRKSVDFDFFTRVSIDAGDLMRSIPYLDGAEPLEVSKNTLTCLIDRGGKVKMQFFGGLPIGIVEPRQQPEGGGIYVASLIDLAGTKVKVLPERAEEKDYIDVDALLKHGVSLPAMMASARAIYGGSFNPVLSLKALSYFADVPRLPKEVRERLSDAALSVDLDKLPLLRPHLPYGHGGRAR
ncbi:MAG: nucleotidyl transferase AbiEii/AbiGii toxin family protein [Nitrospinae bacterium]|nr:nucleotidyl transferase AbiEii/AbiGii toxin family protein [Nitrospinota bacterium]